MKNKLLPAIVIGAAVGGAIALLDKGTRESVVSNSTSNKHYATNADDIKARCTEPSTGQPSKIEMIKDEVLCWKDTIEEMRRNNPELEQEIMDAKDTFQNNREKKLN